MDCGNWIVSFIKVLIPIASLSVVVSIVFIEKYKNPSPNKLSDILGSFLGYFSLFVSNSYVLPKGRFWRYLFLFGMLSIVLSAIMIKYHGIGVCLK